MLAAQVVNGKTVVLVASKGGDTRDPDWYQNIIVHPDVELVMRGMRHLMTALSETPEEKAELWPRVEASFKPYAKYQRRSSRDMSLVIGTPRREPRNSCCARTMLCTRHLKRLRHCSNSSTTVRHAPVLIFATSSRRTAD
jgi:deazaflavin-dependent oxidoreductase (nitroreductase family)